MHNDWRDLIKPKAVEFDEKELTPTYGRFFAEPLERGYGITIGNGLRRILLSSLPGFAITAVRMKNVLHEFSTMQGVKEDVTDVVLNLKEVRLRLHEGEHLTATLKARGEGTVSARDITGGPSLEVLTPDQHIATLEKGADLEMELVIRRGRGYAPAERTEDEEPIGTIRLDAVYSPIKKVNFTVTNARVGQRTDYDRLALEIWTDGSISPRDALTYAARVARDQMTIFAGVEEEAEAPIPVEGGEQRPMLNEYLYRPVEGLRSTRSRRSSPTWASRSGCAWTTCRRAASSTACGPSRSGASRPERRAAYRGSHYRCVTLTRAASSIAPRPIAKP